MTLDDFLRSEEWQKGGVPICQWPGVIWKAAQAAERERIKSRVKGAAESLWCIRNQVGDEPYGLYIGPSLNTLEQFVEKLLEE